MDFVPLKMLSSVLMLPLNFLLLALIGLVIASWYRTTGFLLVFASLAALGLLSMPAVGSSLAGMLEGRYTKQPLQLDAAQAIVILGAGSYAAAPEYSKDTVAAATLERVRWGAKLHRRSGLPVMVSGGRPFATQTSEADQMSASLSEDFRVEAKWREDKSLNTAESARYARQLFGAKINRIVLVTHATHMRRASLVFRQAGFKVIEAPTGFSTFCPPGMLKYFPSVHGLAMSHAFLYEVIGLGWYHARLGATEYTQD